MCKVKTPNYTPPPERAGEKTPDNRGLYDQARAKAAERGGGRKRSTVLTGLASTLNPAMTANRAAVRPPSTLG